MKKNNNFNAGDKVFAKVKGYPAWPAKIISESGKKYNVEFYGTGETGCIKCEDIFYYLKNKEKLYRPSKRKDYMEAVEQIEEAIKNDGGDGDPEPNVDDSITSLNATINSVDTPVKGKKAVKRKRSLSEKTSPEAETPKKMGRPRKTEVSEETTEETSDVKESETPNKQTTPTKKSTRAIKVKEEAKAEIEPEPSPAKENDKKGKAVVKKEKVAVKKEKIVEKKEKIVEKDKAAEKKEKTEEKKEKEPTKKGKLAEKNDESADEIDKVIDKKEKLPEKKPDKKNKEKANNISEDKEGDKTEIYDEKIEVVPETFLTNNIAYAKMVKEFEAYYKEKPVEPREDFKNQVLPVKLPSSEDMGGLKLHLNWPLKFGNEYDRALYDESVANRVLDAKLKVSSGDQKIINDSEAFIKNIEINADAIKKSISLKDLETKKARIARLKTEAQLTGLDAKIKNCLGLDKADPKEALGYLESMGEIEFDDIMLKKHTHIVEMVRRLRKYVGNTKEWNMSEESLNEFSNWAEKVRAKAESVYSKFKEVMKLPENSNSFWDGFMESVSKFRADCKDLTETQIYRLCAEPRSRQAFLDLLEELETEKENSTGGANTEVESTTVNGTAEAPTTA